MGAGAQKSLILTAAIVSMAYISPALAIEIEDFFGVWGDAAGTYDCKGEPGTEVMPVSIGRDEHGEISVGAYAWLCSAKDWRQRGAFLWAEAACGHEGDAEITSETLELAIANYGRLVLVRDTTVDVLEKCQGNG